MRRGGNAAQEMRGEKGRELILPLVIECPSKVLSIFIFIAQSIPQRSAVSTN